MFTKSIGI